MRVGGGVIGIMTAYELATVGRMARRNPALGDFYRAVYERVEVAPELNENPRFRNLSRLFDDSEDSAFWDWGHVTEEGNRRIAEQIAQEVLEILVSFSETFHQTDHS